MLQHFYVICNIVNFVDMELSAGVIKWVHSLSQKKNRDKERCFVAEGTKCVIDTLDYFKVRYLFATSDWADSVGCRLRCGRNQSSNREDVDAENGDRRHRCL